MTDQHRRIRVVDHAPKPGPLYWDWRCLECDLPVRWHAGLFARLWRRVRLLFGGQAAPPVGESPDNLNAPATLERPGAGHQEEA